MGRMTQENLKEKAMVVMYISRQKKEAKSFRPNGEMGVNCTGSYLHKGKEKREGSPKGEMGQTERNGTPRGLYRPSARRRS